jgi:PAS domain S-box-containing protein
VNRKQIFNAHMDKQNLDPQLAILVIENSSASIVVTNPFGVLLYVNPTFEQMTGYAAAEVCGRPYSFLQCDLAGTGEDQPGIHVLREAIREGKSATTSLWNYRKSGEQFLIELNISPLRDSEGRMLGFVGTQQEITDRAHSKQAKLEVEVIRSTMDVLGEVFGNFNHEMRHPLSRVSVSSYLIRRMVERGDTAQVETVTRAVEHEINLVRSMLDRFSHLQRLFLHKPNFVHRVSLADVIAAEVSTFRMQYPDIRIALFVEPHIPGLFLDVDEIGVMVRELLSNMTVHNDSQDKDITVSAVQRGDHVVMRFTNNGHQISEADVLHLFRPFFRGDRARTADSTRVGLGLSLVARIAEIHYGRAYLDENADGNVVFAVELPLEIPTQEVPVVEACSSKLETFTQEVEQVVAKSGRRRTFSD